MQDHRIALIAQRYATCRTYADRGTVFLNRAPYGRFTTRFVRDGEELDFVYDGVDGEHYELAARGGLCRVQLPPRLAAITFDFPVDTPNLCIAGLTGISLGAALHGPRLLLPDQVEGPSVVATGPMAPTRIGEDPGALFFAIPTYGATRAIAVVDARTLLLRAVGDAAAAAPDWTRFDAVVLYEDVALA